LYKDAFIYFTKKTMLSEKTGILVY